MAASGRSVFNYLYILLIYFAILDFRVFSEPLISEDTIQQWTDALSAKMKLDFIETTGFNLISETYNKNETLTNSNKHQFIKLTFEEVDPEVMIKDVSKSLADMLNRKKAALKKSVDAAEQAASNYVWNSKITTDDVDYVSAKKIMDNDTRLEPNERFKQRIMPNVSSVHIPVEIFDGDVEILNGLAWSGSLDETFKENFEQDSEILWQYFGSQTGFMRTYPGSQWKTGPKEVDLYDVRRRPWYTQGSSSPKDMMILIDVSGSVFGQALELIKVSVKSLLDTLGENDFVNIATFSQDADYVTDCFNGSFVQANYRNKKILMENVDSIEAGGMANYKKGLSFAFEAFNKLNESDNRHGASCNRMIMLLTDGGSDYAEDVYDKYNPQPNQTYRVFTYAVGPTANPVGAITWMACRNRGYFSKIPAMGAIRSKVQFYMDFPVRALETFVIPLDKRYKYSIYRDNWGLGMMTTVTLPVYNRTAGSNNQTILGVMGVDVTTEEMMRLIPRRKFGPNGFPFALNSNGYIVFHDGLKPQRGVKDPPNVDFLDVEVESDKKEELRKNMIDMKEGRVTMESLNVLPDQRHVDRESGPNKRTYYYQGIEGTTFSLGLSIPAFHKYYLKVEVDIPELLKVPEILNASNTALLIANWEYYPDFLKEGNVTGTLLDLEEALRAPAGKYLFGNLDLIYHLLWDLKATHNVGNSFWPLVKTDEHLKEHSKGMQGLFVGTSGGLTRIYPKSEELVEMFENQRDTWSETYFKRAIDSDKYIFSAPYVLKPEPTHNGTVNDIMIVKAVTVSNSNLDPKLTQNPNYKAAVVGAIYSHDSMLERLMSVTTGARYGCDDPDSMACYLLDDGAFLLVTNQEEFNTSVGRFFGHIDVEIMKELYNRSVYEKLEQYDYQALCSVDEDGESSSAPLRFNIPSLNLFYEFLTFNWWTSVVTWTFTNLNLYNLLFSSQAQTAEAYIHPEKEKPCIKMHAMYFFKESLGVVEGQTEDCEVRLINCTRSFIASPVDGTNLLLVVTEPMMEECKICQSRIDRSKLVQEPTKIGSNERDRIIFPKIPNLKWLTVDNVMYMQDVVKGLPNFCQIKPRYRNATDKCFDRDPREVSTKCAGSLTNPVSYLVTVLVAIATTLLIRR